MSLDSKDVADRVAALVRDIMTRRGIARALARDEDLQACGLSSLDTVALMLSVETEFAVRIPERQMIPANFRTIGRIAELVSGLLHQPAF